MRFVVEIVLLEASLDRVPIFFFLSFLSNLTSLVLVCFVSASVYYFCSYIDNHFVSLESIPEENTYIHIGKVITISTTHIDLFVGTPRETWTPCLAPLFFSFFQFFTPFLLLFPCYCDVINNNKE